MNVPPIQDWPTKTPDQLRRGAHEIELACYNTDQTSAWEEIRIVNSIPSTVMTRPFNSRAAAVADWIGSSSPAVG